LPCARAASQQTGDDDAADEGDPKGHWIMTINGRRMTTHAPNLAQKPPLCIQRDVSSESIFPTGDDSDFFGQPSAKPYFKKPVILSLSKDL